MTFLSCRRITKWSHPLVVKQSSWTTMSLQSWVHAPHLWKMWKGWPCCGSSLDSLWNFGRILLHRWVWSEDRKINEFHSWKLYVLEYIFKYRDINHFMFKVMHLLGRGESRPSQHKVSLAPSVRFVPISYCRKSKLFRNVLACITCKFIKHAHRRMNQHGHRFICDM